ncbi:MAG: hypothetical protein ACHRHE_02920 [Tepidisphaerales bacterium]
MMTRPDDFDPSEIPALPPTDESGEVDVTLIESSLSKTVAQRFEEHYAARLLVEQLRQAGEQFYGSSFEHLEAAERM